MDNADSPASHIAIIAPNVSENLSGEAIKAFQYAKYLCGTGAKVTLIAHGRSRPHLQRFPEAVRIRFIEDDFWQLLIWRAPPLRPLIDIPFFLKARRLAREIEKESPGTVFHYLGPVSPITPRFPPRELKCVLGPITGNIYYPPALRGREPFSLRWRRWLHAGAQHAAGVLRDKKGFGAVLISGGERTRASLSWAGARANCMRDVFDSGIADKILALPPIAHEGVNKRFVANGRLMPHKGVDLAIRAVARTKRPIELDIFGKGPEEENLRALIDRLGLGGRVRMRGWLASHDDLVSEMRSYRGFIFPSMAEANGIVVQEALAMGLPVVCLNWGGPAALTRDDTAIRIDPKSEDFIVGRLAESMDLLAEDPALATRLSSSGIEQARRDFAWPAVAAQWRTAFETALSVEDHSGA